MPNIKSAFSGFSVKDAQSTKEFYTSVLGLEVDEDSMGLTIHLPGATTVFVYPKEDHTPASFTVLNFEVENIEEAVAELKSKGVQFEHYSEMGMGPDEDIARGKAAQQGPDIAWFKDPSGNILSVLQN